MIDRSYQQVLLEFKIDIFHRLTIIVACFCIIGSFLLIYVKPLPHHLVLSLQLFSGFILYIRYMADRHPNLARYLFVILLYLLLCIGMLSSSVNWLPFMIAPILFISELLVSRASFVAGVLFLGFTALLVQAGYAYYPLEALLVYILFVCAVSHSTLKTIWVLLHWYFSMFGKSNVLLDEARTRRAELLGILKSLEIAREIQQRLQSQLVHARQQAEEARKMKERFASNISHELRTPLNIILGFTEIMHLRPEIYGAVSFPPKLQQDIYQIHRNSRHLLDMIDDVLDLSHIEMSQFSLNFERTDLRKFLYDTVELISHLFMEKPIEFIVMIADDLPEIQIDRTRIRQVIINLLNNAQRFTFSGSVTFSAYADEKNVFFCVTDTGIGIPQGQVQLIFEEFFQVDYSLSRSNGGAGLGLAITRRFIEAHNGRLYVESQEGQGSTFTFTLPLPRTQQNNTEIAQISRESVSDTLWLVLDADPHVSKLITRHTQGCSIVPIDNPEQLDSAMRRYNPQGIIFNSSQEASIPEYLMDLPIPVVTCSLPSTTQMVRKLGVNGCLAKPILPQQLIEYIEAYQSLNRILVIDDDIGVVQLVQRSLENSFPQLIIQRAYNGEQACEIMKNTVPDLVLLDLAMPTMSGFEIITLMKDSPQLQDIPIILLTATKYIYSEDETHGDLRIHQQGGLKPMGVLKLLNMITQTVNT